MLTLTLFVAQILILFILSRQTIKELFIFLRLIFKREKLVFSLVSIIFLPGTALHEMAHFFMAMVLMLKVRHVKIFPEWQGGYIRLGSVIYEKKDFMRAILVGIAPVFVGIFFFWVLTRFQLFPSESFILNLFFGYLVFAISTTMFSSKQDLKDLIFLFPVVIIVVAVIYVFQIKFEFLFTNKIIINSITGFLEKLNFNLFLSVCINLGLMVFLKLTSRFLNIHSSSPRRRGSN